MFGLFDRFARQLVHRGLRRALLEGDLTWLAITLGVALLRVVLREQKPKVVTEHLRVGESIVVTHLPARPKPRARRAKDERSPS